jgi:hypothetical protein
MGMSKEPNLDRRRFLQKTGELTKGVAAAGALAAFGTTAAEAADIKFDAMTGAERLNALEDEATQLLAKIKALKEYQRNPLGEGLGAMPNMDAPRLAKEIVDHAEKIGKMRGGLRK